MTRPDTELDLSSCDREPIHIPGSVQPFGAMLACDSTSWTVTHASENIGITGLHAETVIGHQLKSLLGRDTFHAITNALSTVGSPGIPGRLFDHALETGRRWNISVNEMDGRTIVEFEPVQTTYKEAAALLIVRSMLARMQGAQTVLDVCRIAADQLRLLIDFDRVMIYRFLEDGSGRVIAESRVDGVQSFLGHHYPASDIPKQARALYLKNWLRLIADVDSDPVPILAAPEHRDTDLDLTYCSLRSVSPIHIEYLQNMGVRASMSISIIVGGSLWGLIACHNSHPRIVPPDVRVASEFFGQAFSLQLQTLERADVAEMLHDARRRLDIFMSGLPSSGSLVEALGPRLEQIASLLPCDGVGLWANGQWLHHGLVPPAADVTALIGFLDEVVGDACYATNQLPIVHAPAVSYAETTSGLLAVPLSRLPGDYLILFRKEVIGTIAWAGNPDKIAVWADGAERLSPRKSFELWREEVRHRSAVWEPQERLTAEALRMSLFDIVLKFSELTAKERTKAAEQQRVYATEFNHRVKNALALIRALVSQSKDQSHSLPSFVADLEGRIRSLAMAHDLATRPGTISLQRLLEVELAPFNAPGGDRLVLSGPTVHLDARASTVLSLVIHELTTNAVKYGSLSVPEGMLNVRWSLDGEDACKIEWVERNGPKVGAQTRTGFGSLLITRQIAFELGGRTSLNFYETGLEATFWIPAENLSLDAEPKSESTQTTETRVGSVYQMTALDNVLVVEDSLILAVDLEAGLRRLGARNVYVSGNLEDALVIAEGTELDVAILDINLKDRASFPVADRLTERGIPFIFATGYGRDWQFPERFDAVPVLAKPFTTTALQGAIEAALAATHNKTTSHDG